ncbi:MAG: PASTA domain-containing protein [Acetomicrobium sp.]|jgi:serine/threonine-protein kinase
MRRWVSLSLLVVLLVLVCSGLTILYFVFFGGGSTMMPDLVGESVIVAMERLQQLGLLPRVEEVGSYKEPGVVLEQLPEAGTKIKRGRVAILKVSSSGERFPLPDIRGMQYESALHKIEEAGFVAGDVLRIYDKNIPPGVVIAQSPAAPSRAPLKTRVNVLVSLGPNVGEHNVFPLPNVTGMNVDEAKKALSDIGIFAKNIEYVDTISTQQGIVMATRPKEGTQVTRGSQVTLVVSSGKAPQKPQTQEMARVPGAVIPQDKVIVPSKPAVSSESLQSSQEKGAVKTEPAKTTELPLQEKDVSEQKEAKQAKIRYPVPPLSRPLSLEIKATDKRGERTVLNKEVKGGEYIKLDVPYTEELVVTIYLGGEFVWEERYF